MPQKSDIINESITKIVDEYKKNSPKEELDMEQKHQVYHEMLDKMTDNIQTLHNKKQISTEHFENANNTIDFYSKHVEVLPHQSHPTQVLGEIPGIDFSQSASTVKIKEDRFLTQMQAPGATRHGNFFAEGILPNDHAERANQSGIGKIANTGEEKETKSVYIAKTSDSILALKSAASAITDGWSDPENTQFAQGGGKQLRIETKGYYKVAFKAWGEIEARNAPSKNKPLATKQSHVQKLMDKGHKLTDKNNSHAQKVLETKKTSKNIGKNL